MVDAGVFGDPKWWITQPTIAGAAQFGSLLLPVWSIDVEMQFYVLAPLVVGALAGFGVRSALVVTGLLLGWGLLRNAAVEGFLTPELDLYVGLFLVGVVSDRFEWRPSASTQTLAAAALFLLVGGIVASPATRAMYWLPGSDLSSAARAWHGVVNYVVIALAVPIAIGTVWRVSGAWDRWCGDLSYPLYLFHWLPCRWLFTDGQLGAPIGELFPRVALSVLASAAGAIVLLHAVDRPLQRARARWLAGTGHGEPKDQTNPHES